MEYACWKCMKRRVLDPGSMCKTCLSSDDRRARRLASNQRSTETHERTIRKYEVPMEEADMDALAYRDWMNRQ